ncbi:MAG: arginine deiminase family protein [Thermaerobacter sp.]|nr:arginine deiminase family protein [Thermaerobacter sp.]
MYVQGDRWLPSENAFSEDMGEVWGDWYCDSEVGRLRAVLMHRPGPELEIVTPDTYQDLLFDAPIHHGRFREQFDALVEMYRSLGVAVHLVEGQRLDRPNAVYVRDLYTMTPEGAILARPATRQRRGEERAVASTLAGLGVPILKTVNAQATYEGSNVMWLDRTTCLLGTSSRTNGAGADQVEHELRNLGVESVIRVAVPYGQIHVDGFISMVDKKTAVISPWLVTWDLRRWLLDRGFTLIVATNLDEVGRLGTNFVCVEPRKVIMAAGFPETRGLLEANGIEAVEVEIDEILRGGGAVHCMTGFLKRDPV